MMTLAGCGVTPNAQRNFTADTRLIMDVTIGHVWDLHHQYKSDTLQHMTNSKNAKYAEQYQSQRYAFAPIVANSLGQFGADTLQLLWNLADNHAQIATGFSHNISHSHSTSPPSTQQDTDNQRLRGLKYHDNRLRLMTCVMEGITTLIIGHTFNLTCSPDYARWMEHTRHNWLSILPTYDPASQDSTISLQSDTATPVSPSAPQSPSQTSRISSDMELNTVVQSQSNNSQSSTGTGFNSPSRTQISQASSDMELSTEDAFIDNHSRFRRARDTSPAGYPEYPRPAQRSRVSYASSLQIGRAPTPPAPSRNLPQPIGAPILDVRAYPSPSSPSPIPPT